MIINSVSGKIIQAGERLLVIKTGAFTISCFVPRALDFEQGADIELITYLHWNQEQGPQLFGFKTIVEREIFLVLIACSGIGPKLAIVLLDFLAPAQLAQAVQSEDVKLLSSVPGIGSKKAEQLLVQLRHSLQKIIDKYPHVNFDGKEGVDFKMLTDVLASLQYDRTEISRAVAHVRKSIGELSTTPAFDLVLRKALQFLSQKK